MKIALIHATTTAIKPIVKAFQEEDSTIELLHFMDTSLLTSLEKDRSLTPDIVRRFSLLLNSAVLNKVDCIQLTCSAFNPLTSILQPLYKEKLFRSDEAMLDEALTYKSIGLIATVEQTPIALNGYLQARNPNVLVKSLVDPGVIHLLFQNKQEEHDERVRKMMKKMDGEVDVIVLSQYSMAHIAEQMSVSVPVLTAPKASAKRCITYGASIKG